MFALFGISSCYIRKENQIKTPTPPLEVFLISQVTIVQLDLILISFFSFRLLNKANIHQLQQSCNLRDKGSHHNSGFTIKTRSGVSHSRHKKLMCHCTGGDHRSVAQRREVRRDHRDRQTGEQITVQMQGPIFCLPQENTHTQKKRKYLHGRGRETDGRSFTFECLHFSCVLFPRLLRYLEPC